MTAPLGSSPQAETEFFASSNIIRVATYNIRALRDDAAAVVRVLRSMSADVVCIQEAPRFLLWRRRCYRLADACNLRMIAGGRAAAANLLLAAPDVDVLAVHSLKFSRDRGLSVRGAALARLRIRDVEVCVVGTHLDGVDAPRLRHIDELQRATDVFRSPKNPLIIGVDVNAEPGTESWRRLTNDLVDAAAVTASGDPMTNQPLTPTRRIDALFVSVDVGVRATWAIDSEDVNIASDHRPVLAELHIDPPRAPLVADLSSLRG